MTARPLKKISGKSLRVLDIADGLRRHVAVMLHQQFKWQFVGRFNQEGFRLTSSEILRWAKETSREIDVSEWWYDRDRE